MYIQQLGEIVPPRSQNTVEVCNKISLLILYYITSGLVTLLKVTDVRIKVPNIFYLTVNSSSSISAFRYASFFFLKCLQASRLTLFRLSTLLCLGSCTHCILACFLWSKFVNFLHQTVVHAASIRADLDCLQLRF